VVSVQRLRSLYRSLRLDLSSSAELLKYGVVPLSPVSRFIRVFFDSSLCSEIFGRCFDDPRQTLVSGVLSVASAPSSNRSQSAFSAARRALGVLMTVVKAVPSIWIYKSTLSFALGLYEWEARPVVDLLKALDLATDFSFDDQPKLKTSTDHIRVTFLGALTYELSLKLASGTITSEEAAESVYSILDTYVYLYRVLGADIRQGSKIWESVHRAVESLKIPEPIYKEFYDYFDLLILDAANIAVIHLGADPMALARNGSLKVGT